MVKFYHATKKKLIFKKNTKLKLNKISSQEGLSKTPARERLEGKSLSNDSTTLRRWQTSIPTAYCSAKRKKKLEGRSPSAYNTR